MTYQRSVSNHTERLTIKLAVLKSENNNKLNGASTKLIEVHQQ